MLASYDVKRFAYEERLMIVVAINAVCRNTELLACLTKIEGGKNVDVTKIVSFLLLSGNGVHLPVIYLCD